MRRRLPRTPAAVAVAALSVAGLAGGSPALAAAGAAAGHGTPSRHVLLLSVDGLHESDLAWYVTQHPTSALASLVSTGADYTAAQTTYPSDSFPGMVAQVTGATPATSGVYYDDTFNHAVFPGGTVDCSGAAPGAEVSLTEAADRSQDPITLDAGQGLPSASLTALPTNTKQQTLAARKALTTAILAMTPTPQALLNPAALPVDPKTCLPIYPNQYVKVNTVFEVARQHGLGTAWSDKHPAYAILDGPSGSGIQDLFTPEINSAADSTGDDWTTDNALTQEYDSFKVAAVLHEIAGKDHAGTRAVGTPAIFGMNFQSVSTAEKLPLSDGLAGGYTPQGTPGPLLRNALRFVDSEVGQMTRAIATAGIADSTTIILSAKHGQSPISSAALRRVDDGPIIAAIDSAWAVGHPTQPALVSFAVDDDNMLLWLADRSPAATAFVRHYLLGHSAPANTVADPKGVDSASVTSSGLTSVYGGSAADRYVGAANGDPRTPDIIGIAQYGVVYTGGVKKIAEHGGAAADDRDVPLVVSGAGVDAASNATAVSTTQIAPTILSLLGLDPRALDGVAIDHTATLPGLGGS